MYKIVLILLFTVSFLCSEETPSEVSRIDIFAENAGDFLDINIKELESKAFSLYQKADYENAARAYLHMLKYKINDGGNIYNLACCYGLLGKAELAAMYLKRAVKAGFDDIEHIRRDSDFDKVRGNAAFDSVFNKLSQIAKEKEELSGKRIPFKASSFLQVLMQFPTDYKKEKKYDLVIGLHGFGSSPENFMKTWTKFKNPQFIFVCARAPYAFNLGSETGYSWSVLSVDKVLNKQSDEMTEEYIVNLTRELKKKYKISNIYLLGFSQGCSQAYKIGIRNHELYKGIICFGGWLDKEYLGAEKINEAKELRTFISHGKKDNVVDPKVALEAYENLKKAGYKDLIFSDFDGAHAVLEEELKKVKEWIEKE
ncbi:MAG: hypothetical protein JXA60_06720 [Candidatus Coatesbacteria bacterium]|nr:hypothetical protein [Candidatus Coatesbacteria bacterium]